MTADTLIQRAVPSGMLGRVYGLVTATGFGGSTLAYAAGGPLLDATSARAILPIAASASCWSPLIRGSSFAGMTT